MIDLGCGAGFDVFLASKKVGETGRAIGVDMTDVRTHFPQADSLYRGNVQPLPV